MINPGGVVSAATFAPVSGPGHAVVPGGIASLFGENLANDPAQATILPLPTVLAGTTVTVNGVPAPLFYVSPLQINFQVPSSTAVPSSVAYGQASIVVTTAAGASDPVSADVFSYNPGIFTQNSSGCGPGAILNVSPDGTMSLNTASNSASPGDYLAIFANGFGLASPQPPDGEPAPADPLALPEFGAEVQFYTDPVSWFSGFGYCIVNVCGQVPPFPGPGQGAGASFDGKAPGFVGLDQVNVALPLDVPQGCAVPLRIATGQSGLSQPVTVSIRAGGGQCVDPPIGSAGTLGVTRSVVMNDDTIPESDTLTASFQASPGMQIPAPQVAPPGGSRGSTLYLAVSCAIPGYSWLDAGNILVAGPGGQVQVPPTLAGGQVSYQASLGAGFVQPGTLQMSSAGGANVGAFQTAVNVGGGVQITSQFPKGELPLVDDAVIMNWTGGQPGEVATLKVIEHQFLYDWVVFSQAAATDGTAAIWPVSAGPYTMLQIYYSTDIEVVLDIGPDPSQPQVVQAPGLTLGAEVSWTYEYRFVGLSCTRSCQ